VQEDEQPVATTLRLDEHLVQVAVRQVAVQRETHEPGAARRVVAHSSAPGRQRDDGG
jgi:hypothetical protein